MPANSRWDLIRGLKGYSSPRSILLCFLNVSVHSSKNLSIDFEAQIRAAVLRTLCQTFHYQLFSIWNYMKPTGSIDTLYVLPVICLSRSHWLRGQRRGSAAARLLGLRLRIAPVAVDICFWQVLCVFRQRFLRRARSLVQRSPTECGASVCDREASLMRSPWPTGGCWAMGVGEGGIYLIQCLRKIMKGNFLVMQNYVFIFVIRYLAVSRVHGYGYEENWFECEVFVYDSNH